MITGEVGKTGSVGPQGPPGPTGEKGPEGQGLSGVSYVRWGRTNCSGDATVVYNGKCRSKWNTISQMPFGRVSELFSVIAIHSLWTQSALSKSRKFVTCAFDFSLMLKLMSYVQKMKQNKIQKMIVC